MNFQPERCFVRICLSVCLILSTSNVHAKFFSETRHLRAASDFPFSFPPQQQNQTTITELVEKTPVFSKLLFSASREKRSCVNSEISSPIHGQRGLGQLQTDALGSQHLSNPQTKNTTGVKNHSVCLCVCIGSSWWQSNFKQHLVNQNSCSTN